MSAEDIAALQEGAILRIEDSSLAEVRVMILNIHI